MHTPHISAILAMSENRVIGHENQLPWYLPADLKYFKTITTGHPILMGRKTYDSIGRPLPNRTNIVLTRNKAFKAPGCIVVTSMQEAIQEAGLINSKDIFIIGGADVYKQCMSYISQIYLTTVHEQFEGDVFFPELNMSEWKEMKSLTHAPDSENVYAYTFSLLERVGVTAQAPL
jgi:dihydrofolate reductase